MSQLTLLGCRPQPLGDYLKALGVLRLVAQQADPRAQGFWQGDSFRLESDLDRDELTAFFLERYRPTPVLSPWNKDAGFKQGNSTATATLEALEADPDPRFEPYQEAIAAVRRVRNSERWEQLDKKEQVSLLRNELPDEALDWIDAAVVLRSGDAAFPAVVGTGGNLGRLELSSNYFSRLRQVFRADDAGRRASFEWLEFSLFGIGAPRLSHAGTGQFSPGGAGGLRASSFWFCRLTLEPVGLHSHYRGISALGERRLSAARCKLIRRVKPVHGTSVVRQPRLAHGGGPSFTFRKAA